MFSGFWFKVNGLLKTSGESRRGGQPRFWRFGFKINGLLENSSLIAISTKNALSVFSFSFNGADGLTRPRQTAVNRS